MSKRGVAVIGLGQLGRACAEALIGDVELELAGFVRRPATDTWARTLVPEHLRRFPVATHISELEGVHAALVCVPTDHVLGVARELLQARVPIVECARLEGRELAAHHASLEVAAEHHHVAAVTGAGWDPGALPLLRGAFEMMIPHGRTLLRRHTGLHLRHCAAAERLPGVRGALAGDYLGGPGAVQHYVYVALEPGVALETIQAALAADPLFAGESTQVFAVADLSDMEHQDELGLVLERLGQARSGAHPSLMLEARFDPLDMAARVMLDAARRLPQLRRGAHRYTFGL